jgi:hypothetical protein
MQAMAQTGLGLTKDPYDTALRALAARIMVEDAALEPEGQTDSGIHGMDFFRIACLFKFGSEFLIPNSRG